MSERARQAGFTLIELVVVFAILGLVLALLVTRINGPSPGLRLRAAANELAAGLREARSAAILRNGPVAIVIDAANRDWRAVDGTIKHFPLDARVGVVPTDRAGGTAAIAIRFEADGSSSGGRVDLAAGRQRMSVAVNWLTGRVRVSNAP